MNHIRQLGRWPLLLGATLCILGAVYLFRQTENPDDGRTAATILVLFAAFLLGGFLVDWGGRKHDDEFGPKSGGSGPQSRDESIED